MTQGAEDFGIDPDDPRASDRLGLACFLVERGVAVEGVRATRNLGEISRLAWSHIFDVAGEGLTIADVARGADLTEDQVERTVRALGLGEAPSGLSERDIRVFKFLGVMIQLLGEDQVLALSRVIGSSMGRIAEALAASTRVTVERPMLKEQRYAEFVRSSAPFIEGGISGVTDAMDRLLRYHMLGVSSRGWDTDPEGSAMTMELAVGFADMVGFTYRSAPLSTSELVRLIDDFEGRVTDTIVGAGGRVVKFIGDEVLFAFGEPTAACACSLDLIRLAADAAIPDVRVGIAYGNVVSRYGDYYGNVVNLASRLVEIAPAGTVLVTPEVAERASMFEFEPRDAEPVKGLEAPLEHLRLV